MDYNNTRDISLSTMNPQLRSTKTKMLGNHLKKVKSKITLLQLLRTSLYYQTKEFFNNSTLHGVRYIGESERPFGERFMWFCFTMIGFISALVIIFSLWEKYQTNPTITGLDMDVHNQQLVFPTIVVCPHESYDSNRTHEVALMDLGDYNESYVDIFEPFLKQLTQLTFETMNEALESSKKITVDKNYVKIFNKTSLRTLMFQANVLCNDIFEGCTYRDETIECCDHFHQMYTEHGFCFGFNSRYIDQSDAEQENKNFLELFETDKKWALRTVLKSSVKVFVHAHQEHFGWDFRPHVFDTDNGADLLISLKQTYTTEDAKQLSVKQRKCLFDDEMKLKYFDHEYTFTACSVECRIRNSLKFCGCVPPFYRQIPSKPYCTIMDIKCLARFTPNITNIKSCDNCELSCANTVFDIEKLTKGSTEPQATRTSDNYVNVEFLTWPIIRYKREVLFGWVDLLVSFGGIAGLFLGFSLLSGVEIAYYFTMRTFCMLYMNRQELYEIEEEKLSKPPKRINLSLSLIRTTASESNQDPSIEHRVEINEISSRIEPSNQTTAAFGPNSALREKYNNGKARINQLHMTKVAKKVAAVRAINRLNRLPTSYDFAETNGPYYMP